MIILDTNVISELFKPEPHANLLSWFDQQNDSLKITSITVAELCYGVALLPTGKRKQSLEAAVHQTIHEDFRSGVLDFDKACAVRFGELAGKLRSQGIAISKNDAMIAAIVAEHQGVLVTRNEKDFRSCEINIVNPFQ